MHSTHNSDETVSHLEMSAATTAAESGQSNKQHIRKEPADSRELAPYKTSGSGRAMIQSAQ